MSEANPRPPTERPDRKRPETISERLRGLFTLLLLGFLLSVLALVVVPTVRPEIMLPALVPFALAGLSRSIRRFLLVMTALLALALALLLYTPVLNTPLNALVQGQTPSKANAIVVFGDGTPLLACGSGELTAVAQAQLAKSLALRGAGWATQLVLPENASVNTLAGCNQPQAGRSERLEQMLAVAATANQPAAQRLGQVGGLESEQAALLALAGQQQWTTLLLVVPALESKRLRAWFGQHWPSGITLTLVAAEEPRFDLALLQPSDRLRALGPMLREYWLLLLGGLL
jgi:hypothetical protein